MPPLADSWTARLGDRMGRWTVAGEGVIIAEAMKPSDFLRDERYRTAGPPVVADGVVHIRSHADVRRVLLDKHDKEFSRDLSYWVPDHQRAHLNWYFMWATGAVRMDGSLGRHQALRAIGEPWFRTQAMQTMAATVKNLVEQLLDSIVEKGTGEVDFAHEFAYRLALRGICAVLGFPLDRELWLQERLGELATRSTLGEQLAPEPDDVEPYLWDVIKDRQAHPRHDLLDVLIAAWSNKSLSNLELLGYIWGSAAAGMDTTGTAIANAFGLFAEFDLLDTVRQHTDDDSWLDRAIDETLRFNAPFPTAPFLTVSDVTLSDGMTIPRRTAVQVWFSAANRDPAINGSQESAAKDPAIFDVQRSPNRHLTFGAGPHHCLGAEFARLMLRIALQTTFRRLPGLESDPTREFRRYAGFIDGVSAAPFRFDQAAAQDLLND